MFRRVGKLVLIALLTLSATGAMVFAGIMWRLSQGPLPLSFLTATIQQTMNENLPGMKVGISDVIIERDQATGEPRFRLRDLSFRDLDGNLIARAPRAAVGVDGYDLMTGKISANKLELIGARLMIRRKRDGTFQLGFGDAGTSARTGPYDQAAAQTVTNKSARGDRGATAPEIDGSQLLDIINKQISTSNAGDSALSNIERILVSRASISLYDESNDVIWYAPQSNLQFKQAPYGFVVFVDATVASGVEPWRSEIAVTYRRVNRAFTISARVFDLVPADIADDVFALSQLAQVKLPLSGHIELEVTESGVMTRASAELSTARGRLDFPEYISKPVLVDEGLLRFDYEPETGDIVVRDSSIFVEGMRSDLRGRIQPLRKSDGRLSALRINLAAKNTNLASNGDADRKLALDRIEFAGVAGVEKAELAVEDLLLLTNGSGVRIRGRFVGEDNSIGMYLAGRIKDLPLDVVKKLWPPIVAPGVRQWVRDNVETATIPDGTFQLRLPGATLASAIRDKIAIPDEMIDLKFRLADVTTRYFGELPAITGAAGGGHIRGNHLDLELASGLVTLPSGKQLKFVRGTMTAKDLAPEVTPTVIKVIGAGPARDFLELLDQKPLELIKDSGFDPSRLSAQTHLDIRFDMPLQKQMTGDMVKITAGAELSNVALRDAFSGLDIDSGNLKLSFGDGAITANGPVKIKGIPVKLNWTRVFAKNGADHDEITAKATLDEARRRKLGVDLSNHLTGPVQVTMKANTRNADVSKLDVTADLTKASLRLDPIRWNRPAGRNTKATFKVDLSDPKRTRISGLNISGKDFSIKGNMTVAADGTLTEASFSEILLNKFNHFAIALKKRKSKLALAVTGKAFDGRPLINSMFASGKRGSMKNVASLPLAIETSIARVYANRGEIITNMTGQLEVVDGVVSQANLQGRFINGAPITLRVAPNKNGARQMRLVGNDSGGALRAANLYSKISGGSIDFWAQLRAAPSTSIEKGKLVVRNFKVRNEAALTDIEKKSKRRKTGPRNQALKFSELVIPFSTDKQFVRIGRAHVKSPELGALAQGSIRRTDGLMNIGGTITPAYAVNAALGEIPIVGALVTGGPNQGIFGLNFALAGTMSQPRFKINPVSAIAPGIFRNFFAIGGGGVAADGTPAKPKKPTSESKTDR